MRSVPFRTFLLCLLASSIHISAYASDLKDFAGSWALKLGDRNLFIFTLSPSADCVTGTLDRPSSMSATNSLYANITNTSRRDLITKCHFADAILHITTQNSGNPKDEDSYAITIQGNQAQFVEDDIPPGEPYIPEPVKLTRVAPETKVSTDWEPNRAYTLTDSDTSNAEMKAIYDQDQHDRMTQNINWKVVGKSDAERREKTRKLLADGALHTGKDYEEAAFVFQHGDSAQDYLLAHTLAMVAISKGDSTAIWIAAATLDRYLETVKQQQVFGTQYSSDPKQKWTQEPYDRTLVSDALRNQLGVPSQATQAKQLKAYQDQQ
ncbi:hypothetical protein [Terracidiphilus gabretensis]|jgi:hypothetical protein|uniref:hypothetical protein n=1 Tax=Terracidiphilus gabretensis TaxID=1577687 RepID=UPI00071B1CE5|nr:hypothetical protein [Terracidiphilus gabretensis]